MNALSRCEKCGSALPVGALGGLCPRCLLEAGLDSTVTNVHSPQPNRLATGLPERFGAYHPVGVLGEGGMGIVYLA